MGSAVHPPVPGGARGARGVAARLTEASPVLVWRAPVPVERRRIQACPVVVDGVERIAVPVWHRRGIITRMAMNLRLDSDAEEAVRREAKRVGRSQQDVIREAVSRHLGITRGDSPRGELSMLVATGTVRAPRTPYQRVTKRLSLPPGVTSASLLDREDRI